MESLEILVIEQDDKPHLNPGALPSSCRHVFVWNPGVFNKSWGFNIGWHETSADILVFSDADILIGHDQLRQAIESCVSDYDVVRPWSDVVDLTEEETQSLIAGSLDTAAVSEPQRRGRSKKGEFPPLCGGIYVIGRDTYERLGGQDERFRGWGGEDDAMSIKVGTLLTKVALLRDGVALHMNHPRQASLPVNNIDYRHNVSLLREYRRLSREELDHLCGEQRLTMGDPNRFD